MAWRLPAARDRVRLAGLTALELNGKTGHVVMFHSDKGRYEVSVEGCPGTKAIKRANLELLGAGAPGAAALRCASGEARQQARQQADAGCRVRVLEPFSCVDKHPAASSEKVG